MAIRILLLFLLVSKLGLGQLIFETGFKPNSLPSELYTTSTVKIDNAEESFAKKAKREDRLSLKRYYENTNFQIDKLFQQGKVSSNNSATKYIEDILLSMGFTGYKVYIYLSPYANAFATDRKEIFVNAGLFSLLDNEAELAFILCHEAMHVNRRHTLSSYMNEYDIDVSDKEISKLSVEAKVEFTQHAYSKNVELEADSLGLNIFSLSDYDIKAPLTSISKLDRANIPLDGKKVNLEKVFLGNYFSLKKFDKMIGDTIDKESTTHPSSELRYETIKRRSKKLKGGSKKHMVSQKTFNELKTQVLKHLPSMYLNTGNVNSAIYSAVQLMNKDNEFAHRKTIVKSIYRLLIYKRHAKKREDQDAKYPDEIIKIGKMFWGLSPESLLEIGINEIDQLSKNKAWAKDKELAEIAWRFRYEDLIINKALGKDLTEDRKSYSENRRSFKSNVDRSAPDFITAEDSIVWTSFKSIQRDTTSEAYSRAKQVYISTMARVLMTLSRGTGSRKLRKLYHYDKFDIVSPYYNKFRLNKVDIFRPVESDEGRSKILKKYQKIQEKNPGVEVFDNYLLNADRVEEYCQLVTFWTFLNESAIDDPMVATMPTYFSVFSSENGKITPKILIQQNIANASRIRKFNWLLGIWLSVYYVPLYALTARTGAYVSVTSAYDLSTGQLVLLKDEFHRTKGKHKDYIKQLKKTMRVLK